MKRKLTRVFLGLVMAVCTIAKDFSGKPEAKAPAAQTSSSAPTVDQVLEKYVQGLGGKAAIEKVKTRIMKGSIELPATGDAGSIVPGTIEIYMKAPDKRMSVVNIPGSGIDQRGFNGSTGWYVDPDEGPKNLGGQDLANIKLESDFYRELRLKELYHGMTLQGKENFGKSPVYVISAQLADGSSAKLYFDAQTGLLVREDVPVETEDGRTMMQSTFEDYKDVDGVKLPFTIHRTRPDSDSTLRFAEIKNNVPIDDAKFNKPVGQK